MAWHWHQLDHMQIICSSLQTDNHTTQFLTGWMLLLPPNDSVKALKASAQEHNVLECGPMPNLMVALLNVGGALCSTPQSLADAHY